MESLKTISLRLTSKVVYPAVVSSLSAVTNADDGGKQVVATNKNKFD